ncbi:MAG: LPS export ABC transporter permease LptF [Alphaproteobacteria bacterium]|nr:LPS export ABC transporter permease LptF [Alphaproteobacteria bacterium]
MLSVFDKYMIKNIAIATLFVALTLSAIIFLTQSLRFLELVIEAGASSGAFWQLTFLALPRFFEVILPLALMVGVVFVYARMVSDSEIVVLRASGLSAFKLSRPAIIFAVFVTLTLMCITMLVGPKSLSKMQEMRQVIKSQFSALFLKEGVFNQIGSGLTVYIRDKDINGDLRGILIQDTRDKNEYPSTVIAKRGVLVSTDRGFEVLVHDGSRQEFNKKKQILNRLNFDRYIIDLPNSNEVNTRWAEPDERTIFELIKPDLSDASDVKNLREFRLEIHKRFVSPILALSFALIGCVCLLVGPYNRRGQVRRIMVAVLSVAVLQGAYLTFFNVAKHNDLGLWMMYAIAFGPIAFCLFMLSKYSEKFRRRVLYGRTSS